jgi:dienelactone hydrolase
MTRLKAALFVLATFSLSTAFAPLHAEDSSAKPAETVEIPLNPLPFVLNGPLRRPDGEGPFPAIILLPACGRLAGSVEQVWGQALLSWGYVTLTLDVFTPRGIVGKKTCVSPAPPELAEDAYRGLNVLAARKFVDARHVFVIGFGRSSSLVFAAVERDGFERTARRRFRGAVAFYPPGCGAVKGVMTVATLVIAAARDPSLEACRNLAEGRDDMGISRQRGAGAPIELAVMADAYAGFDLPDLKGPVDVQGYHMEYSQSATDQAKEKLGQFLQSMVEQRP